MAMMVQGKISQEIRTKQNKKKTLEKCCVFKKKRRKRNCKTEKHAILIQKEIRERVFDETTEK